jgi:hypothetical protein
MGIEGPNTTPQEGQSDAPDFTREEVEEPGRRIVEAREAEEQRDRMGRMSAEELAELGIKKTIGPHGEVLYDHGYSPDTGTETREMHIKLGTEQRRMGPEEVQGAADAQVTRNEDFKRRNALGEVGRLPSRDEL